MHSITTYFAIPISPINFSVAVHLQRLTITWQLLGFLAYFPDLVTFPSPELSLKKILRFNIMCNKNVYNKAIQFCTSLPKQQPSALYRGACATYIYMIALLRWNIPETRRNGPNKHFLHVLLRRGNTDRTGDPESFENDRLTTTGDNQAKTIAISMPKWANVHAEKTTKIWSVANRCFIQKYSQSEVTMFIWNGRLFVGPTSLERYANFAASIHQLHHTCPAMLDNIRLFYVY